MKVEPASEPRSLRVQVEASLREAIITGELHAGERLVEQQVCERLGVSRSVLRECLAHLEGKGLVESTPYRGFSVASISVHSICEIFELRIVLEGAAAELFTERASPAELEMLEAASRDIMASYRTGDPKEMLSAKNRYYSVMIAGTRNSELERSLEHVRDRIEVLRGRLLSQQSRRPESLQEIKILTRALIDRDRVGARDASRRHLESARAAILAMIGDARSGEQEAQMGGARNDKSIKELTGNQSVAQVRS